MIDTDMLYYIYCVKMRISERNFWNSPLKKVVKLIDMYQDEMRMTACIQNDALYNSKYFSEKPEVIHSMREVEGFT